MKTFAKILSLALVAVMLCMTLVACGPASDPDKAEAALKDNGYTAIKVDGTLAEAAGKLIGVDGLEATVTGTDGDEWITIYYFEDADAAKTAMEKVEDALEDKEEKDDEIVIKKSGKMIYGGTKAAVKAAK